VSYTSRKKLPLDGKSVGEVYLRRIEASRRSRAFLVKADEQFQPITWEQVHDDVAKIYRHLETANLKKGDAVIIFSHTCYEWVVTDLAILAFGAVTVPLYESSTAEDIAHILKNSGAKLVFVESKKLTRPLIEAFNLLKKQLPIVSYSSEVDKIEEQQITAWNELTHPSDIKALNKRIQKSVAETSSEDMASIIYTSGTTGKPKGVVLTHGNFVCSLRGVINHIKIDGRHSSLCFLPLAHVFGRFESMLAVFAGVTVAFAENVASLSKNLKEVRPSFLVSVPRIYEKIHDKIQSQISGKPKFQQDLFHWAVEVGRKVVMLESENESVPIKLNLKHKVADQLVLKKIREQFGGNIAFTASGGAPFAPALCAFFHACGVHILEGYGLTETLGPILANQLDDYRFGTVGKPIKELNIKIAEDGEILLQGPVVFKGYYNNPKATKDAFTEDHWFKTGDIGQIDDRGFLKITDRKKELIITAGGKNIAPQKIENQVKMSPFISQCVAHGDKKKYISALVTVNEPELKNWLKNEGIKLENGEAITEHKSIVKLIGGEISHANESLARYETIKKFKILPKDFSIESGELTPSLKVKRRVVQERYKDILESLY